MSLNERIAVNFEPIDDASLFDCISRVKAPVDAVTAEALHMKPTFFEIFTVIAFLHFALKKVDAAAIEVGLGGRLDATNAVRPVVTGITPISMDHTAVLGGTLSAIAREKAGIAKRGVRLVVGRQEAEAFAAIEDSASLRGAPTVAYGRDYFLFEGGGSFDVRTPARDYRSLRVALLGGHQRRNAAMAVMLSEIAAEKIGIGPLEEKAVARALGEVEWGGRVELIQDSPPVVIDAAHNAASACALAQSIGEAFPGRKAVILVGIAAHKDTFGVIDALAPIAERFVATTIPSPRSESAASLSRRIESKCSVPVEAQADRGKALQRAMRLAGDGLLVVTGSFYLAGEVRAALLARRSAAAKV
jgi:dihydrofolate synthase/folylpolyglutamate synthase